MLENEKNVQETTKEVVEPKSKKEKAFRSFHIVQQLYYQQNPTIKLIDEEQIQKGLQYKTIKRWAYILHDKDVLADGKLKAPHYHIVVEVSPAVTVSQIAKWFGVPPQQVARPKYQERGYFLDSVGYLTHENSPEKYLYTDEYVKANFDFRDELNKKRERMVKYGDISEQEYLEQQVLQEGRTLYDVMTKNPLEWAKNRDKLSKLRNDYLKKGGSLPISRTNFYISGLGGVGKDAMSVMLARALCPEIENDEELYFHAKPSKKGNGNPLDGYDGQPVIIWSEWRAITFLETFGREQTFKILDPHPSRDLINIKYSYVRLLNKYNIINSVQPYGEFLDGLAGKYTDKNGVSHDVEDCWQSYRRIPFIIQLTPETIAFYVNRNLILPRGDRDLALHLMLVMENNIAKLEYGTSRINKKKITSHKGFLHMKNVVSEYEDNLTPTNDELTDEEIDELIGETEIFDTPMPIEEYERLKEDEMLEYEMEELFLKEQEEWYREYDIKHFDGVEVPPAEIQMRELLEESEKEKSN